MMYVLKWLGILPILFLSSLYCNFQLSMYPAHSYICNHIFFVSLVKNKYAVTYVLAPPYLLELRTYLRSCMPERQSHML